MPPTPNTLSAPVASSPVATPSLMAGRTYPRFDHFTPFDTARPIPTPEDKAAAEAFVARNYDNAERPYCPVWLANHRASLVESFARIEQQKRLIVEFRAGMAAARSASQPQTKRAA